MIHPHKLVWIATLSAICLQVAPAQPCYESLRREGINAVRQKNYADAMNQFWAAFISCPDRPEHNDLSDLIKDAQQQWVRDLEESVRREKKAYQDALAAKEQAETAKHAEEKARLEAEDNARKAREQGIRAEALRLALLADIVRQQGRKSEAVLLAWLATQLSGAELSPFAQRKFGEAVRDSFTVAFFKSPAAIDALQEIPDGGYLLHTTEPAWYRINGGGGVPAQLTKLSPEYRNLTLSPDGRHMVADTDGTEAFLLDASGQVVATLHGHTGPIRATAFSADNLLILTCSRDSTARVWDLRGNPVSVLRGHAGKVYAGFFAPDAKTILTRASDGSARLWKSDGTFIAELREPGGYVLDARYCGREAVVATLDAAGSVRWWDAAGKPIGVSVSGQLPIRQIEVASDGNLVARGDGPTVWLYDSRGKLLQTFQHPSPVDGMACSADGSHFLFWCSDHRCHVWARDGTSVCTLENHLADIIDGAFSQDNSLVLTTAIDGTARLWDLRGNQLSEWPLGTFSPTPAVFARNAAEILAVTDNRQAAVRSPAPSAVYNRMEPATLLRSPAISRLLEAYNVQFYDALRGK